VRVVSGRIAEEYVGKTAKTVTRDLNILHREGLVSRSPRGIRPSATWSARSWQTVRRKTPTEADLAGRFT